MKKLNYRDEDPQSHKVSSRAGICRLRCLWVPLFLLTAGILKVIAGILVLTEEGRLVPEQHSSPGLSKLWPMGQFVPVFVDTVLLEDSHAHLYCLWLLSYYKGREIICPIKSKVFTIWSFTGEILLIPALDYSTILLPRTRTPAR